MFFPWVKIYCKGGKQNYENHHHFSHSSSFDFSSNLPAISYFTFQNSQVVPSYILPTFFFLAKINGRL